MLHPLRIYRLDARLTQRGLADLLMKEDLSLLGSDTVSEQWVRRLETGMVNPDTDFTQIIMVLFDTMWDRRQGVMDIEGLERRIEECWKVLHGATEVLLTNVPGGLSLSLKIDNPSPVAFSYINQQIQDWYSIKRAKVRRRLEGNIAYDTTDPLILLTRVNSWLSNKKTVYAFCQSLGLHPFSVQSWIKENSADVLDWPGPVRVALREAGVIEADG